MSEIKNKKKALQKIIETDVFVKNSVEQINSKENQNEWLFDFRRIILKAEYANLISELFYEEFQKKYPFQIGGLEVAGIPLVTSIANKFYEKGHKDVNSFFIRKSRKKTGLLRMIEGTLEETRKIILVDDLINSGASFLKQITILGELGYKVDTVWTVLCFRDKKFYTEITGMGIQVKSLFDLNDLTETISTKNLFKTVSQKQRKMFDINWKFQSKNPNLQLVVPKSQPILDDKSLFFGTDQGTMFSINQQDGSVNWSFKINYFSNKKGIFSSPALYQDTLFFGGYDGTFYALNKNNGKLLWRNGYADYIGSSPAINEKYGIVYVGVEMSLPKKQGGITALDIKTGKTIWTDFNHQALTHASPLYIEKSNEVIIGSNEGAIYCYDGSSGDKKWEQKTFGGASYDWDKDFGFGEGSIKMSPSYDSKNDYVALCSIDGFLYLLKRKTGEILYSIQCEFACWSTPIFHKDKLYWSSLDKHLYCLDVVKKQLDWKKNIDNTRIFAGPTIINDILYIGTNAGRVHLLDTKTNNFLGYHQTLERITNYIVYNSNTKKYFLPTFANEIICLNKLNN